MKGSIPLYYGDNGIHKFWESASRDVLIFKNHGEKWWQLFIDQKFIIADVRLSPLKKAAQKKLEMHISLDTSHQWISKAKGKTMFLLAVE